MIPRVLPQPAFRGDAKSAFARCGSARPLRIVVDTATVIDGDAVECLRGFAHHAALEILIPNGAPHPLTIGDYDPEHGIIPIEFTIGDRRTSTGVYASDYHAIAGSTADAGAADEAERASVLAAVAEELQTDALATRSAYLLEQAPRAYVREANPMTPEEAVALLGLYLRLRSDFTIDCDAGWQDILGRHFSYFVLMRELLPSSWRWFSGCVAHSKSTGDDELMMVAQSAMERVDRALRARDRMHGELQQPPGRQVAEEVLFYFDVTLLMLGGAFDATASVAHGVHQLALAPHTASWANKTWRRELAKKNLPLAQLMAPGQPASDVRELVAILRNTIHSQAMRTISYRSGGEREELVVVPRSREQKLETLVRRQQNAPSFAVNRLPSGHLFLDPGHHVEALMPLVTEALNAIMDATPVESFYGVDPTKLRVAPPPEETHNNIFHPAVRRRLRLLAGLA